MLSSDFHQQSQPLLYEFSSAIKHLTNNLEYPAFKLKKVIDKEIPKFADNEQHDAQ